MAASPDELGRRFGKLGRDLHRQAQGIDLRPVITEREAKSISQETTFAQDVVDSETLKRALRQQAAEVGARLQRSGLAARTVTLKVRWSDFTTRTRQVTAARPLHDGEEIGRIALDLLAAVRIRGEAVRLIGVGGSGLVPAVRQMSIFDTADDAASIERAAQLRDAVKRLRTRFGEGAIKRGSEL